MKKVCVIGLGYIGLPTSVVVADHDFEVIGFDIDMQRVERINSFDPVIEEPEIKSKLTHVLANKQFYATSAIESADCFIIAVPTPFKNHKQADLSFVWQAADTISTVLKKGDVVILESTVPVGATQALTTKLSESTMLKSGIDFFVAHCPERVLPGNIFHELIHNARIIGGINEASVEHAALFYKRFVKAPLYLTNATTAEMVKLVENSSRDVAIAFANQVAAMAYKVGLNPFEVIELANKHPRVNILNPSCGVGGHCIAVDPWFLIETFPAQTSLLQAARRVNDQKPREVVQVTKKCIDEWQKVHERICKLLVLGLTYKPDIDDVREAPALQIAKECATFARVDLLVCEPYLQSHTVKNLIGVDTISLQKGIEQADVILALVKHCQFKHIDKNSIRDKKVLDFCGIFYQPRVSNADQEFLFWPASNAMIDPIIEYAQGE